MTQTCWVVCDQGKVGTQNQCLGLAEGLGFNPLLKPVTPRFPWVYLPASLWGFPLEGLSHATRLAPPWPDLIVASGRASVAPTAKIRRLTAGRTKVIQLQNPRVSPDLFDAVIAPRHDGLQGASVIETKGALHRVTQARRRADAAKFRPLLEALPRPITTVLLGGTNACYRFERPQALKLLQDCHTLLSQTHGSLAVTLSRRTSPALRDLLRTGLSGLPHIFWGDEEAKNTGEKDNPYFAFLEVADHILVTCDSVSMISEACSTGKPVYVYPLPGGSKKFRRFHALFEAEGFTRPYLGQIDSWDYEPLEELPIVLKDLRQKLQLPSP